VTSAPCSWCDTGGHPNRFVTARGVLARRLRALLWTIDEGLRRFAPKRPPEDTRVSDVAGAAGRRGDALCVFAHFDPNGRVASHVLHHLRAIRDFGCDVVFVTTSPSLGDAETETLRPLCVRIVRRRNVGIDFGSWRVGLEGADLASLRRVVLANDSVYGPFRPLRDVCSAVAARGLDVWGMTASRERGHHLQSYFVGFERRAIESGFVRAFADSIEFHRDKRRVIERYEIGLTEAARRAGLTVGALWEPEDVARAAERDACFQYREHPGPWNATLLCWDVLLRDLRFPYLKTEVLKLDRHRSRSLGAWRDLVRAAGDYDPGLVAEHLRSLGLAVPGDG
jgi:lipopolysaccharide biosynthesis protein